MDKCEVKMAAPSSPKLTALHFHEKPSNTLSALEWILKPSMFLASTPLHKYLLNRYHSPSQILYRQIPLSLEPSINFTLHQKNRSYAGPLVQRRYLSVNSFPGKYLRDSIFLPYRATRMISSSKKGKVKSKSPRCEAIVSDFG